MFVAPDFNPGVTKARVSQRATGKFKSIFLLFGAQHAHFDLASFIYGWEIRCVSKGRQFRDSVAIGVTRLQAENPHEMPY
jgi:hypothetical protein